MEQITWNKCTNPTPMINFLETSSLHRLLQVFACRCTRRISGLIPTEAGRKALELSEYFCLRNDPCAVIPKEVIALAQIDEEQMRVEMVAASQASQVQRDATCTRFYAAIAARMTAEFCSDLSVEAANDVSDNVALASAFYSTPPYSADGGPGLPEMQAQFSRDYDSERAAHCELLRELLPVGLHAVTLMT
ncbi:MAG: hypothetical protein JWM11_1898 [Planctomycetaceae bacterium]|nr:hypothetical protein [Planctomycetaceae bacterium]